jgi:transposase InsO family protein
VTKAFIDANRHRWAVAAICRAAGFSERSYYAAKARTPCARQTSDVGLRVDVRRVWEANHCCYGARRVWLTLARQDVTVARCTVERLMAEMGIRGVQRGSNRRTTIADPFATRAPDLVERRFVADRPNDLWLADITYASSWEGWLYVSFITDVFSRMIVGWQIADHLRTDLVLDALEMAIFRRDVTAGVAGPVHHSDAGSQYTSFRYSERLVEAGISASIGTVGDSYDNAMAEALNGTYKAELVKLHGPWRTRAALERATIDWIYWYNDTRLHGEIGDIPPAEYESNWYNNQRTGQPALTH